MEVLNKNEAWKFKPNFLKKEAWIRKCTYPIIIIFLKKENYDIRKNTRLITRVLRVQ